MALFAYDFLATLVLPTPYKKYVFVGWYVVAMHDHWWR